jgi:hypothetical protein
MALDAANTDDNRRMAGGMDIALEDSKLRQALDVVADELELAVHPHQIERFDLPYLVSTTFKCLPIALGLIWQPGFPKFVSFKHVGAARFIRWLSAHRHLQQQPEITDGCLVLYFSAHASEEVWQHAGIGQADGRIVSKWDWGQLMRHPVDQVPAAYGNIARAYQHPGGERALALYRAYVEDCDKLPEWARRPL